MTSRTRLGRFLARVWARVRPAAAGRTRLPARLSLDPLPDRDGPCSLVGGDVSLLSAMHPGDAPRPASGSIEPGRPAATPADGSAAGGSVHLLVPPPVRRTGAADRGGGAPPAPPAVVVPASFRTAARTPPTDGTVPDAARVTHPVPLPPALPPTPPPRGTPPAAPERLPESVVRVGWPAVWVGVTPRPGPVPRPTEGTGTPAADLTVAPPSAITVPPPEGTGSKEPRAYEPPTVTGTGGHRPPGPAVVVAAGPGVGGGHPVGPDTEVFRVIGTAAPGVTREVGYTLAAHTAAGTVAVRGAVAVAGGAGPVAVTPGPDLVRRPPEVLTITLGDRPGGPPGAAAATLFVTPGHQVGDAILLAAHRVGRSAEAFGALVRRHEAAVTQVCQRIVGNRADAEDVRQFVFLELARTRAHFPGTLTGWLRAVARNAALAFLRSKRRRLRHERGSARPVSAGPAAAAGLDEGLSAALEQLPVELGEAVRLRYLEGYTQQEAARIVGCPRGTLSRRAAHGIRALRDLLRGAAG